MVTRMPWWGWLIIAVLGGALIAIVAWLLWFAWQLSRSL